MASSPHAPFVVDMLCAHQGGLLAEKVKKKLLHFTTQPFLFTTISASLQIKRRRDAPYLATIPAPELCSSIIAEPREPPQKFPRRTIKAIPLELLTYTLYNATGYMVCRYTFSVFVTQHHHILLRLP